MIHNVISQNDLLVYMSYLWRYILIDAINDLHITTNAPIIRLTLPIKEHSAKTGSLIIKAEKRD